MVFHENKSMFNVAALKQVAFIRSSAGFDATNQRVVARMLGSKGQLVTALREQRCILSMSFFAHGRPGLISVGGPGQNVVMPGSPWSGIQVSALPHENFVQCDTCVDPAQVMLYSCRSMLGPDHQHYAGEKTAIRYYDEAGSIGAGFAMRFGSRVYGAAGAVSLNYWEILWSEWPIIALDPTVPDNYHLGGRWATLFGPAGAFLLWPEPGAKHAVVVHTPQ
jgi:hypothetical protein